jgi:hypothetical protein
MQIVIVPPCRVYFYLNDKSGEEYAAFDVDFGEINMGSKFRMQLVQSKVNFSETGLFKHVERIGVNPLYSGLANIQSELNSIVADVKSLGWKVRVLPLENRKLSF